jgi:hypothetical protein
LLPDFELLLNETLLHCFAIHDIVDVAFANEEIMVVIDRAKDIRYMSSLEDANDIVRSS